MRPFFFLASIMSHQQCILQTRRLIRETLAFLAWNPYPCLSWIGRVTPGGRMQFNRRMTDVCAICTGNIQTEHDVVYCASQCGHTFHHVCIYEWRKHSGRASCPTCRSFWTGKTALDELFEQGRFSGFRTNFDQHVRNMIFRHTRIIPFILPLPAIRDPYLVSDIERLMRQAAELRHQNE